MSERIIGHSVERYDIATKVMGSRKYPQDFRMDGQWHAAVVWSAHPHARLLEIDPAPALALTGVHAVLTHRDVPNNSFGISQSDQRVLAQDKVRSLGDPVALVVAETPRLARLAAAAVQVHYEPMGIIDDPLAGMERSDVLVHEELGSNVLRYIPLRYGEGRAGFAHADLIIEGVYSTPRVDHAFMQPEAGLGYIDDKGRVTVICAAQWPHEDIPQIAHALGLPEDQVHEIVPAIGGAFGGREDISLQILVALAAYRLRRPVKMVWSRADSLRGHGKRHPFHMTYRTGATQDGRLTALEVRCVLDAGAYASTSVPILSNAVSFLAGPYVVPHVHIDAYAVYTNNIYTMAMRGFGATQPAVAYEQQMDKLAEKLGMDPVELRMRNLLEEGSPTITGSTTPIGVGIRQTLEQTAQAAGWQHTSAGWHRPDPPAPSRPGRRTGIGVACAYKNIGYSFGFDDRSKAQVLLHLNEAGQIARATLRIGTAEVGQGVLTTMAQITAEVLGIEMGAVRLIFMDSAETPNAGSSSASRHTFVSGNAVRNACLAALEKWHTAQAAGERISEIAAEATFRTQEIGPTTDFDPLTGQCQPHITMGYGTQIAFVEVDEETGEVEVCRIIAADDVGRVIHPGNVFGQAAGGLHMGIGFALTEEFIQQNGQILTPSFATYQIPTIRDMPAEFWHIPVEVPDPRGPFGAKGLGEIPTLPTAPAVLNAIHAAAGIWIEHLPVHPEKVLWALLARKRRTAAPAI